MTRARAAQRSGLRPATRNGFTLIELLVSAVIFLLILFAIYLVNETSHTTYTRGEVRTEIHQTARTLMLSMTTVVAVLNGIVFAALKLA